MKIILVNENFVSPVRHVFSLKGGSIIYSDVLSFFFFLIFKPKCIGNKGKEK